MNILFLAPQPFYDERGTPIAVDMALKVLSKRGDPIDVVTYHLGNRTSYANTRIFRTPSLPFIRSIPPGFSWKKVICDLLMLLQVLSMAMRKRYQLVHAVEESVFIALVLKVLFKIPYIYDMDSSLSEQMVEKYRWLYPFLPLFSYIEGMAVRHATAVVPVCEALSLDIGKHRPQKVVVLWDVSLLENEQYQTREDLRRRLPEGDALVMYVGNLEAYQGIDLLLESFALVSEKAAPAQLVLIGGKEADIHKYQTKARRLNIDSRVHFLGPKSIAHLSAYLSQADILVSPRIKGKNTPMKIYSYLASGKPVLATNLPTHTQVLNDQAALLAEPTPEGFSAGLAQLIQDDELRRRLGEGGKKLIEERHTFRVFQRNLNRLYNWIALEIGTAAGEAPSGLESRPEQLYPAAPAPAPASTAPAVERLGQGVEPQELRIHYQPIVSLDTGEVRGFEALVRWYHPELGLIPATEFISVIEESGQILSIGYWVLREACRQLKEWKTQYPSSVPLTVSVNLSASQLSQPELVEQIDQILEETGIDTQSLRLEIPDRAFIESAGSAAGAVYQLRARGVQLNIDYYGADGPSLDHLDDLPVHSLKIDRALIQELGPGGPDSETVQKVVGLARRLGADVVAVGVETTDQLKKLRELKCEYGQGYIFSRPLDSESVGELIASQPRLQA